MDGNLTPDEARLLAQGDPEAWFRFGRQQAKPVMAYCLRRGLSEERAEAAVARYIRNLWVSRQKVPWTGASRSLNAYLKKAADNCVIRARRDTPRGEIVFESRALPEPATGDGTPTAVRDAKRNEILQEAIGRLPPSDGQVVEMFYLEGLTGVVLADRLGMTLAALEARLNRIRKELRWFLGPHFDDLLGDRQQGA